MSKNIQTTELSRKGTIFFSDFFTDFSRHAQTGELNKKTNENAVKQSVRNLLLTGRYERLFQPEVGSNLRQMLFENATPALYIQIKEYIEATIKNYEPRAEFVTSDVSFDHDRNTANVTVIFRLINSTIPTTLELILERIR
tara:strand:+ start:49 stop:471 length:423 start_codon:yes stop_codon:yes gene_type:complete